MQLPFTTVDVFTTTRYRGNPLAVIRVPAHHRDALTEDQKQAIAREFNLSEVTFLHDVQPGEDFADYDIFTVDARLNFAGHPTIGTAIWLAGHRDAYEGVSKMRTRAGEVPFVFDAERKVAEVSVPHDVYVHKNARLSHPFPADSPSNEERLPVISLVKGMTFILVPMASLEALGKVREGVLPIPEACNNTKYMDQGSGWDIGYIGSFFYCDLGPDPEDEGRKLVRTRMFGPRIGGYVEDPGTGSASCALTSYLALQEDTEKGEGPFSYHLVQGVEMGRQCDIFIRVKRTADGKAVAEVKMSGTSVKVMEGVVEVGEE